MYTRFSIQFFFFIRQHEVPPGKHALITVRQPKGNLVWIQTQTSSTKKNEKEKFTQRISTWDECSNVQVIYKRVFVRVFYYIFFCWNVISPVITYVVPNFFFFFNFSSFLFSPSIQMVNISFVIIMLSHKTFRWKVQSKIECTAKRRCWIIFCMKIFNYSNTEKTSFISFFFNFNFSFYSNLHISTHIIND